MDHGYRIRFAQPSEALLLATQRLGMFHDMGRTTPEIEPPMLEACHAYFTRALADGEYVGWVAELIEPPHAVVGGAGVQFRPMLPRTDPAGSSLLVGREGLILNVYVEPAHRRRGIARRLMEQIIAWAPATGIVRLVLHASTEGRPLYESLGFTATNEMLFPPFSTTGPTPGRSR